MQLINSNNKRLDMIPFRRKISSTEEKVNLNENKRIDLEDYKIL